MTISPSPPQWDITKKVWRRYFVPNGNDLGVAQEISGLIGALWQLRDNLSFDVGSRHVLINGRLVIELRVGERITGTLRQYNFKAVLSGA